MLIQAKAKPSLTPGLTILPNIGAYLSEFSSVRNAVLTNQMTFHFFRSIYFILSLVMFACFLILSIFHQKNRGYFYGAFYLLLSSYFLAYYTPWISENFDFQTVRFLKIYSMVMSSFVLFSGYLHLSKRFRAEFVNNLAGIVTFFVMYVSLLRIPQTPSSYLQTYNQIFTAAFVYSLAWTFFSAAEILLNWQKNNKHKKQSFFELRGIFLLFGFLSSVPLLGSVISDLFSRETDVLIKNISVAIPFAFSVLAIFSGTWSYVKKSRLVAFKRQRDELTLELIRLINTSSDPLDAVQTIQKLTSAFVKATKSTIYVFENQKVDSNLKLIFDLENSKATSQYKQNLNSHSGVIGYVLKNKSPLLIENVRTDSRFRAQSKYAASEGMNYRTGSCMIIPLFSNSKLVGVLTFADKKNDLSFSRRDFLSALEFSSVLGLLVDNNQMQQVISAKSVAS